MEGRKGVAELIHSTYSIHTIVATAAYADKNQIDAPYEVIAQEEMKRVSAFSTPPGILALAEIKSYAMEDLDMEFPLTLCLDGISDPGNLGTIIRTADWFGVSQVVMSEDCTDFYNPKCLSATMGSFTRCKHVYTDLVEFLKGRNTMGCFLNGTDVAEVKAEVPVFLVVGSESHGIRKPLEQLINQRVTIPGYGEAESLNAGIAAGIVLERLSRALFKK